MSSPVSDDALGSIMLDETSMFALWAIHVGFCSQRKEFRHHFGASETIDNILPLLESNGLIELTGELYRITQRGLFVLGDLRLSERTSVVQATNGESSRDRNTTRVRKIANPGQIGELTGRTRQAGGGLKLVEVRWQSTAGPSFIPESQIEPVVEDQQSLEEHIAKPRFGRLDDLRRLMTFQKLQGSLHEFIYSMGAATIDFLEYQYKPVLKFLDSPSERLLIADEVGLGKTIEAMLIWLELRARRNAKRLLVVCPGMLATKWRREFRDKFGVIAEIHDPRSASEALRGSLVEGGNSPVCWIATYTGLRPWREEWTALANPEDGSPLSPRGRFLWELQKASVEVPFFDLVVFDEAHLMRNPETGNARLGRLLSDCTKSLLCVSATPVNNRSEDLFSLLRLVDQDFFTSQPLFQQLLRENQPAVAAMNELMRQPVRIEAVRDALIGLRKSRLVGELPILSHAIEQATNFDPRDHDQVVRLQAVVEELNVLGGYISRTRRRQVKERRAIRRVKILPVDYSDPERRFYWGVTAGVRLRVAEEGGTFSIFHLITPQLRMASCIPAMIESYRAGNLRDLEVLIESGLQEDDEEGQPDSSPDIKAVIGALEEDLKNHDFEGSDSKYMAFREYILGDLGKGKVVVFSFFRGTLQYLARRLEHDGIHCLVIHGDIPQADRDALLQRFEDDPSVQVLLSSEVGSEGIDLQFCHVLVNYDLPWNPMRVEQRIGRIDRVGQLSETLTIVHLKVRDTIEERLYDCLHGKLQVFENSIGDLESVLGEEIQKLGRQLLSKELTADEENQMIAQTEMAIRTRMEQMRILEESANTLVAHGDFITARVARQRDLGRYISPGDLSTYVRDFFTRNFPGCRESWEQPRTGCFQVDLTMEAARSCREFMEGERLPLHPGIQDRRVWGTFDPEVAKLKHRGLPVPLHNHQSPFIRWITQRNEQQPGSNHPLAAFKWSNSSLSAGVYAYRIERWTMRGLRKQEHLSFTLSNMQGDVVFAGDEAERLLGSAMVEGERWNQPEVDSTTWNHCQQRLKKELELRFSKACDDFVAKNQTLYEIQLAQINRLFDRRRDVSQRSLETMRVRGRAGAMLRLMEGNMKRDAELRKNQIENLHDRARFHPEVMELGAGIIQVGNP